MITKAALVAVASLMTCSCGSAWADTFTFTDGTNVVSFSLPASPTPDAISPNCPFAGTDAFCVDNKTISVNGVATVADLNFFTTGNSGGILFYDVAMGVDIINQDGAPLFTGTLSDPTFVPGFYLETNEQDNGPTNEFSGAFDATITATPEPSSLALLGTGALAAFGTLRRKLRAA